MTRPIYLDYNGTTPHDPEVIAAMRPFLETEFGNPVITSYSIHYTKLYDQYRTNDCLKDCQTLSQERDT